ncbi:hypothetical protein GSH19_05060 [Lactobacillus sp. S2-2]|nr:hypothetical protein [Lactobacillus sp. S2-2]MCF6515521.1 hypothetical protein [Lactobacillus sp. S2-2]
MVSKQIVINIKNEDEIKKLLDTANQQYEQLKSTINKINNVEFELETDIR